MNGKAFAVGALIGIMVFSSNPIYSVIMRVNEGDTDAMFYLFYYPFCLVAGICIGGLCAAGLGKLAANKFGQNLYWLFVILGGFLGSALFVYIAFVQLIPIRQLYH